MAAQQELILNPYLAWQRAQAIPNHTGYFVEDLRTVPVGYWKERNANGAFINLSNAVVNDAVVLEIPRGEKTQARRQVFDESVMAVAGPGATSMRYQDGKKRTFEWQLGSVFAISPNIFYQHYALDKPARLASCTSVPLYMHCLTTTTSSSSAITNSSTASPRRKTISLTRPRCWRASTASRPTSSLLCANGSPARTSPPSRKKAASYRAATAVEPVRFLAFHPPGMLAYPGWSGESEQFIGKGPNQIDYDDEDPAIRVAFEAELAKNGLTSKMKPELYRKS